MYQDKAIADDERSRWDARCFHHRRL